MKKICVGSISVCLLLTFTAIYAQMHVVKSTPSTNVKDTLSNSQLSYFGRLAVGNSANDTIIKIGVGNSAPSKSTSNLFSGDIVGIGRSSGLLDSYIVRDISSNGSFAINAPLNAANITANGIVVATRSAIHTISFTPKSSVTGGIWQVLIKATGRIGELENDGMPDQVGFDIGSDVGASTFGLGTRVKTADVFCPFGTASIGATVVISGSSYHNFLCTLSAGATNPIDVGVTMTIGRDLAVGSQLINPTPNTTHIEGTAGPVNDIYTFFVRHLDAGSVVIPTDTATSKIAVVEAVRVTATVDPNLTFIIDAGSLGLGSTACGNTGGNAFLANAANTTGTSVSFGSLVIGSYNNLAQHLSCTTNSDNGYVVTVYENGPMKNLNTGTTIPNTNCDGACTMSSAAIWNTDKTHSEWGYTLQNLSAGVSSTTFNYSNGYKAFGVGVAQAQNIMINTGTPVVTEEANICYRLTSALSQEAGNYENKLTFTATATF